MMNRRTLEMIWDHLRKMNGIALRLVDALPADRLDANPIPNMRTPKELVVHLYGMVIKSMAEGVSTGEITELDEKSIVASIRTKDELVRYCNDSWKAADRAITGATDAQLQQSIKTPWGPPMPASVCVNALRDEFTHHRGQLYVFVRALGHDVPMVWDFEGNAPEFQPKAQPANA